MSTARLIQGRIERFCAHYHGAPFHAMLGDPPYHLTSIVKRFGNPNSAPGKDVFGRASKGFMGKEWDGGDVAFQPDTWSALASLLYPGAFIMMFAGTRGYHRMAVAMEDAGLLIHPPIGWLFASGFPKATRIDPQIDRAAGIERGQIPAMGGQSAHSNLNDDNWHNIDSDTPMMTDYNPVTEQAKQWVGHRYGGQVLKPAFEFIAVAQVPYRGKPYKSIAKTGAGALNIDAGRIGTSSDSPQYRPASDSGIGNGKSVYGARDGQDALYSNGRWPANLALDSEAGDWLDQQTGDLESGGWPREGLQRSHNAVYGKPNQTASPSSSVDDSGGASRYFHSYDWQLEIAERLENADPAHYQPKASRAERNAGLDGYVTVKYNIGQEVSDLWREEFMVQGALLPKVISELGMESLSIDVSGASITALCQRDSLSIIRTAINKTTESKILNLLTHLLTSESTADVNSERANGGRSALSVENGNPSQKSTGISQNKDGFPITDAAPAIYDLLLKISAEKGWQSRKSTHPTIKPIGLTEWLAKLLLPPRAYAPRRLLVPFAGTGSEMIGAYRAGWDCIVGIEMTPEYVDIGRARLEHWLRQGVQLDMFEDR